MSVIRSDSREGLMFETDNLFRSFATTLELRDRKSLLVKQHAEQASKVLKKLGLDVQGYEIIGSYARGTMINPLSVNNVDVLIKLNPVTHKQWLNPEATHRVLRMTAETLSRHYSKHTVRTSGMSVEVSLPDFRLDVMVGMPWHTGSIQVPDERQEKWLHIDPAGFAHRVASLDRRHNGMIIPLIRLINAWNHRADRPLNGFHVECMVVRRYDGTGRLGALIQSLPAAVFDFFSALPSMLEHPILDPLLNQRVDLYLDEGQHRTLRDLAVDKSRSAAGCAGAAYDLLHNGRAVEANALWGELLGGALLNRA